MTIQIPEKLTDDMLTEFAGDADPGVRPLTIWERLYLPEIARGLWNTLLHFVGWRKSATGKSTFTVQYPEERHPFSVRFRGEHMLKTDRYEHQGETIERIKCVACYMCAAACPAHVIYIVAQPTPPEYGPEREKMPAEFVIDELRCIYCGYCEEACPEDAIALTNKMPRVYGSRTEFLYDRDKLVANGPAPRPRFASGTQHAKWSDESGQYRDEKGHH